MRKLIEESLREARKAFKKGEVPVGCVIFRGEEVIAKAHNLVERLKDPTAHAEMLAIKKATRTLGEKYLVECEAVITLEPCVMCSYAFILSKIKKVYFLALDEKHGGVVSVYNLFDEPLFNHRVKWEYLPVKEASQLISQFFKKLRNP